MITSDAWYDTTTTCGINRSTKIKTYKIKHNTDEVKATKISLTYVTFSYNILTLNTRASVVTVWFRQLRRRFSDCRLIVACCWYTRFGACCMLALNYDSQPLLKFSEICWGLRSQLKWSLPTPTAVARQDFHSHLSLFYSMISQKPMQLGSPNLTNKCYTMSPGNLYFGVKMSRVKVTSH